MWEEILKTALGNGLWAVLFCVLLMYQLHDGRAREGKYRDTINVLLDGLGKLESVEKAVEESLAILRRREKKVGRPRMKEETQQVAAMPVKAYAEENHV